MSIDDGRAWEGASRGCNAMQQGLRVAVLAPLCDVLVETAYYDGEEVVVGRLCLIAD